MASQIDVEPDPAPAAENVPSLHADSDAEDLGASRRIFRSAKQGFALLKSVAGEYDEWCLKNLDGQGQGTDDNDDNGSTYSESFDPRRKRNLSLQRTICSRWGTDIDFMIRTFSGAGTRFFEILAQNAGPDFTLDIAMPLLIEARRQRYDGIAGQRFSRSKQWVPHDARVALERLRTGQQHQPTRDSEHQSRGNGPEQSRKHNSIDSADPETPGARFGQSQDDKAPVDGQNNNDLQQEDDNHPDEGSWIEVGQAGEGGYTSDEDEDHEDGNRAKHQAREDEGLEDGPEMARRGHLSTIYEEEDTANLLLQLNKQHQSPETTEVPAPADISLDWNNVSVERTRDHATDVDVIRLESPEQQEQGDDTLASQETDEAEPTSFFEVRDNHDYGEGEGGSSSHAEPFEGVSIDVPPISSISIDAASPSFKMPTLRPGCKLNDEAINHCLKSLVYTRAPGRFYPLNSLFATKHKPILSTAVLQAIKSHPVTLVPLHLPNLGHWLLVSVDHEKKVIELFDSLPPKDGQVSSPCDEAATGVERLMENIFSENRYRTVVRASPMQHNIIDCGVFVLVNAAYLMAELRPPSTVQINLWRRVLLVFGGMRSLTVDDGADANRAGLLDVFGLGDKDLEVEIPDEPPSPPRKGARLSMQQWSAAEAARRAWSARVNEQAVASVKAQVRKVHDFQHILLEVFELLQALRQCEGMIEDRLLADEVSAREVIVQGYKSLAQHVRDATYEPAECGAAAKHHRLRLAVCKDVLATRKASVEAADVALGLLEDLNVKLQQRLEVLRDTLGSRSA